MCGLLMYENSSTKMRATCRKERRLALPAVKVGTPVVWARQRATGSARRVSLHHRQRQCALRAR